MPIRLGIQGLTLTPFMAETLGLQADRGVLVQEVIQGGSAALAGLQGGDKPIALEGVLTMVAVISSSPGTTTACTVGGSPFFTICPFCLHIRFTIMRYHRLR